MDEPRGRQSGGPGRGRSRVFILTDFVPGETDVDDEAEEESQHDCHDDDVDELTRGKLFEVGHLCGCELVLFLHVRDVYVLWLSIGSLTNLRLAAF